MGFLSAIDELVKARARTAAPSDLAISAAGVPAGKAYLVDPMWAVSSLRYKDKPWGLSYDILRMVAQRNAVVAAILQTRINQVASFWRPQRITQESRGFAIRHRDPKHHPTPAETRFTLATEAFFERCGVTDRKRDRFHTFLRKFVRDSLVLDQSCIELVRDRKGRIAEFHAIDGASIRIMVSPDREMEEGYLQLINARPAVWFTADEMIFAIRNPRTDLKVAGYGYAEIEQMLNIVTAYLYAEEYNRRFFISGSIPKGVLWAEGAELSAEMMEGLRRSWTSQLAGVMGAHKLAVLQMPQGARLNYTDLQRGNAEMEFSRWLDFLINIACAVYQIDPAEVNFPNRGGPGGHNPLFESSQEAKLVHSTDKGLRPLMEFIAETMTEHILWQMPNGEDFLFEFGGVERSDHREDVATGEIESRYLKTVNELRAELDMDPVEGGDMILNPIWAQAQQQKQMAAQAPEGEAAPQTDEEGNVVGFPDVGAEEERQYPSA